MAGHESWGNDFTICDWLFILLVWRGIYKYRCFSSICWIILSYRHRYDPIIFIILLRLFFFFFTIIFKFTLYLRHRFFKFTFNLRHGFSVSVDLALMNFAFFEIIVITFRHGTRIIFFAVSGRTFNLYLSYLPFITTLVFAKCWFYVCIFDERNFLMSVANLNIFGHFWVSFCSYFIKVCSFCEITIINSFTST